MGLPVLLDDDDDDDDVLLVFRGSETEGSVV